MIYKTYAELLDAYNNGEVSGSDQDGISIERTELDVLVLDTGAVYRFYHIGSEAGNRAESYIDVFNGYQVNDDGFVQSDYMVGEHGDNYATCEVLWESEVGKIA